MGLYGALCCLCYVSLGCCRKINTLFIRTGKKTIFADTGPLKTHFELQLKKHLNKMNNMIEM